MTNWILSKKLGAIILAISDTCNLQNLFNIPHFAFKTFCCFFKMSKPNSSVSYSKLLTFRKNFVNYCHYITIFIPYFLKWQWIKFYSSPSNQCHHAILSLRTVQIFIWLYLHSSLLLKFHLYLLDEYDLTEIRPLTVTESIKASGKKKSRS